MSNLYRALREAGASTDVATNAAAEVAAVHIRPSSLAKDLKVIKWLAGLNLALIAALFV